MAEESAGSSTNQNASDCEEVSLISSSLSSLSDSPLLSISPKTELLSRSRGRSRSTTGRGKTGRARAGGRGGFGKKTIGDIKPGGLAAGAKSETTPSRSISSGLLTDHIEYEPGMLDIGKSLI